MPWYACCSSRAHPAEAGPVDNDSLLRPQSHAPSLQLSFDPDTNSFVLKDDPTLDKRSSSNKTSLLGLSRSASRTSSRSHQPRPSLTVDALASPPPAPSEHRAATAPPSPGLSPIPGKALQAGVHSISLQPPTPIDPPTNLPFSNAPTTPTLTLPTPFDQPPAFINSPTHLVAEPESLSTLKRSHHRRSSSNGSHVFKETLNAYEVDEPDGTRSVNQYKFVGPIGKGSYATVERATDRETGIDYAVKEFSKARLRKRAQSEMLRASGPGRGRRPAKLAAPELDSDAQGPDNLSLIRSEVAIMKKVDHPNMCSIHEVVDVTSSDSLLVVMELCEGGPITHVSLESQSPPIPEPRSRRIFIQLVYGIAYLHENGIFHRDIKPDNALFLADKETVKIVDFGVSEMFVKEKDSKVEKSVGSPAFMAPELCAVKKGELHGALCDVWSLGVTLFTLVVGRLPWSKLDLLDLFKSIVEDPLELPSTLTPSLQHLLHRLLDKNPETRITMPELWNDAWMTTDGPLIPYEENCAEPIEDPTPAELDCAVRSIATSFLVAKIANKFRRGVLHRRSMSANSGTEAMVSSPESTIMVEEGGPRKPIPDELLGTRPPVVEPEEMEELEEVLRAGSPSSTGGEEGKDK